jgi:nucleoside-diphosphate-sugar epimerase
MPRLAARARAGRLRLVGDGRNKVDTTYIDNAAQAHFLALEHLGAGRVLCGQGLLHLQRRAAADARAGQRFARRRQPTVARRSASRPRTASARSARRLWPAAACAASRRSRVSAEQLCTPHWYSMEPARRDFGYVPQVSDKEGLRRLRENALQLVDALK